MKDKVDQFKISTIDIPNSESELIPPKIQSKGTHGGFIVSTHQILINEVIPAFHLRHGLYIIGHKVPKAN